MEELHTPMSRLCCLLSLKVLNEPAYRRLYFDINSLSDRVIVGRISVAARQPSLYHSVRRDPGAHTAPY